MSLFWSRMHLNRRPYVCLRSHDGACVHRSDYSFRVNAEAHTVALTLLKPLLLRHDRLTTAGTVL